MIGIFDSGSGGLTVLRAIREVLPSADVVYFADLKHAPYGKRSREELSQLTAQSIQLLLNKGANNIIGACNSVSASIAVALFDAFDLGQAQLTEMVGPTVRYFKGSDAKLLVCATPATVESGIYQTAFRMIGKNVVMCPIPELAGLIDFSDDDKAIRETIEHALGDFDAASYDAMLLSCTHYPLVREMFEDILKGKKVVLFDPAHEVAERVEKHCWPQEVGEGKTTFLINKESDSFPRWVEKLFPGSSYTIEVID